MYDNDTLGLQRALNDYRIKLVGVRAEAEKDCEATISGLQLQVEDLRAQNARYEAMRQDLVTKARELVWALDSGHLPVDDPEDDFGDEYDPEDDGEEERR